MNAYCVHHTITSITLLTHIKTDTSSRLSSQTLQYSHTHPVGSSLNGTSGNENANMDRETVITMVDFQVGTVVCDTPNRQTFDIKAVCSMWACVLPLHKQTFAGLWAVCMCYCGFCHYDMLWHLFSSILSSCCHDGHWTQAHLITTIWNVILSFLTFIFLLPSSYNPLSRLLFFKPCTRATAVEQPPTITQY